MDRAEMTEWVLEHYHLFADVPKKPTREEAKTVFYIADQVDNLHKHKMSNCGRCYNSAKKAIIQHFAELGL